MVVRDQILTCSSGKYLLFYYSFLLGKLDYNRFLAYKECRLDCSFNIAIIALTCILAICLIASIFALLSERLVQIKISHSYHLVTLAYILCDFFDGFFIEANNVYSFDWSKLAAFTLYIILLTFSVINTFQVIFHIENQERKAKQIQGYDYESDYSIKKCTDASKNEKQNKTAESYSINIDSDYEPIYETYQPKNTNIKKSIKQSNSIPSDLTYYNTSYSTKPVTHKNITTNSAFKFSTPKVSHQEDYGIDEAIRDHPDPIPSVESVLRINTNDSSFASKRANLTKSGLSSYQEIQEYGSQISIQNQKIKPISQSYTATLSASCYISPSNYDGPIRDHPDPSNVKSRSTRRTSCIGGVNMQNSSSNRLSLDANSVSCMKKSSTCVTDLNLDLEIKRRKFNFVTMDPNSFEFKSERSFESSGGGMKKSFSAFF